MFIKKQVLLNKDYNQVLNFEKTGSLAILKKENTKKLYDVILNSNMVNRELGDYMFDKFIVNKDNSVYYKRMFECKEKGEDIVLNYLDYMFSNIFKYHISYEYHGIDYDYETVFGNEMDMYDDVDFNDMNNHEECGIAAIYKERIEQEYTFDILFLFLVDCERGKCIVDGNVNVKEYIKKMDYTKDFEYKVLQDYFAQDTLKEKLVPAELNRIRKLYNIKTTDGFAEFLKHFFDVCLNFYKENTINCNFGFDHFLKTTVNGQDFNQNITELEIIKLSLVDSQITKWNDYIDISDDENDNMGEICGK